MIRKRPLRAFLARNPFGRTWTDGLFFREKMRALYRIAPAVLPEGARILEIGGGRSGLASLLYPGAEVITVDLDPALAELQPEHPNASFVCADACALPMADGSFDLVTLFDVLEHIPEDYRAAREALRVARRPGTILASAPRADWRYPFYRFLRPVCPPEHALLDEWGHVRRGYEPGELGRLFGRGPDAQASFINPVTAFFHDISFSRLGPRTRRIAYLAAAVPTAIAYALHRPSMRGTETAYAWRL